MIVFIQLQGQFIGFGLAFIVLRDIGYWSREVGPLEEFILISRCVNPPIDGLNPTLVSKHPKIH